MQWGIPVLFFLDEPCLGMVLFPSQTPQKELAVLHDLLAALRRPGVLLGVHTCARLSPGGVALTTLGQARPDIIAFDAYQGLEVFCADPAAQDFLTHRRVGGVGSRAHLAAAGPAIQGAVCALAGCGHGRDSCEAVARQTLITATCGLGLLPEPAVAVVVPPGPSARSADGPGRTGNGLSGDGSEGGQAYTRSASARLRS